MKGYDLSFRMWRGDLDAGLPEFNYSNGLIKGIIERCENENITKIKCSLKSLQVFAKSLKFGRDMSKFPYPRRNRLDGHLGSIEIHLDFSMKDFDFKMGKYKCCIYEEK